MKLRNYSVTLLLCIGFLLGSWINPAINNQVIDDKIIILRKIIINFLENYFIHDPIIVSVIHLSWEKEQKKFKFDILDNLFKDLAVAGFAYTVSNKLHNATRGNWNTFNLVLVEDSASLQKILNETTVQPMHLNEKFLVVLTGSSQNHTSNWEEALQILWKNDLIDSHVLSQATTNSWSLSTFLPYQNDCITPSHLQIESFTKSNFSEPMNLSIGQLYPEKLGNFNGCPLYIAVYNFWPNNVVEKTIDGRYYYKGFEITITDEVAKALNSTIVYDMPLMRAKHGMTVKNRIVAEVFEVVRKGEANLTVGAYSRSEERNRILSPSDPYFYTSIGFIYKEGDRHLIAMESILTPFNASVWAVVLAFFYFQMLMIFMTNKLPSYWRHFLIEGRMNHTPILNAWATVLGHSRNVNHIQSTANGRSTGSFAHILTILWITLWFFVRSFYGGALFNNMQGYQSPPRYDTVHKVLSSDCKVVVSLNGINTLKFYMSEDRFVVDDSPRIEMLRTYHDSEIDGVAHTSDQFVRLFNAIYSPQRHLSYTKDQLITGFTVYYFPKKSILRDLFNRRIPMFLESGLTDFWYMQSSYGHRPRKAPKQNSQSVLHIENIVGVIQICAIMYLIAFIAFLLEMMSLVFPQIGCLLDYLND